MAQTKKRRNSQDLSEEQIIFVNKFILELCLAIEPKADVQTLATSGRLRAIEIEEGKFNYFLDDHIPLMHLDLNLLIDGT